ncbi:MAG: aminotransferase class III-fold pyridoxal phosphate-dependent enzyme, partial [Actinomycetota bacterium]|nr:aminotransferase class III-fold pyridoxal phosphate-dependent enzyme [Actinomycetota bacterium]
RHVNTFGGNPTACALAIRNLQIMDDEELPERSRVMGERLLAELSELSDHPNVGQIRGRGLLAGIELVEDKETKAPVSADKVAKVISGCKERGLIVGKNGDTVAGFNNVVTLAPPLVVTDEDLAFIVETLKESVRSL